jgi:hypothetical protein
MGRVRRAARIEHSRDHPSPTRRSHGLRFILHARGVLAGDGFLKTCCTIHQGRAPCANMTQYEGRESYWRKASACLGVRPSLENEFLQRPSPPIASANADVEAAAESDEQNEAPDHRADRAAMATALAARQMADYSAAVLAADARRPLDLLEVHRHDEPRGQKPTKGGKSVALAAEAKHADAVAHARAKASAKMAKAAAGAKPAKPAAKPAKPAAKGAKAKPAKAAAKAAEGTEKSHTGLSADDPSLMAKLKAHLKAKEMRTDQFKMIQTALKALASHEGHSP